jgi:hypothetical protein
VVFLATGAPATDPLTTPYEQLQALHRFVAFTECRTGFGPRPLSRDIAKTASELDDYGGSCRREQETQARSYR